MVVYGITTQVEPRESVVVYAPAPEVDKADVAENDVGDTVVDVK